MVMVLGGGCSGRMEADLQAGWESAEISYGTCGADCFDSQRLWSILSLYDGESGDYFQDEKNCKSPYTEWTYQYYEQYTDCSGGRRKNNPGICGRGIIENIKFIFWDENIVKNIWKNWLKINKNNLHNRRPSVILTIGLFCPCSSGSQIMPKRGNTWKEDSNEGKIICKTDLWQM